MNRWLLVTCLLLAPGLALAEEVEAPSDPTARFEQALGAQVDEILAERVDLVAERSLALLETRAAQPVGRVARAEPRPAARRASLEHARMLEVRVVPRLACANPRAVEGGRTFQVAAACLDARAPAR